MRANSRNNGSAADHTDRSKGLFRTHIAGMGRSIFEAFENLERSPNLARFVRHPSRKLFGARVKLPPEEGEDSCRATVWFSSKNLRS